MLVDSPLNALTGQIIGAAIEVHRTLGPGLLESTYMPCLLLGCPGGLLINFNVPKLIDGVKRLMNPRADGGECHTGGAGPVGPATTREARHRRGASVSPLLL